MNWITIIGIVFIAIGTFLTFYGPSIDSKKDKEELNQKFSEFNNELKSIRREDIPQSEKEQKIAELKNEYSQWASEFSNNKELYKLEYQKNNLGLEEKKLAINKEWKYFYSNFFTQLESSVIAYNEYSKNGKIEIIEKFQFPSIIFNADHKNFFYILKFGETIFWKIFILNNQTFKEKELPPIVISVSNKNIGDDFVMPALGIYPFPERKLIIVRKLNNEINIPPKEEFPLNNYEKSMQEIIKGIVQYQVLKLEEK
ncbi:hypothetical protein [Adhaeribacter terreus]|uniref:Uncharacterized protein n=1 Tax=Adhaeribacter terreus TaxID=529703 RepID=A0ABW0EB50_9BACT